MAVTSAAAYGIYPQDVALAEVVHTLNQAGFENEDICMMLAPSHPIASILPGKPVQFRTRGQCGNGGDDRLALSIWRG